MVSTLPAKVPSAQAGGHARDLDVARPQSVVAVAEAGGGHRVGHQGEALAGGEERGVGDLGREVDAVDDRLHGHPRPDERDAAEAGSRCA